jgi:hypothetical protein
MCVLRWHCRNSITCEPSDYFWLWWAALNSFRHYFKCSVKLNKNCTSPKHSTLLIIKLYTSIIQYFVGWQWLLSLSRHSPEFYGTYSSLHISWECHSVLSQSANSQNPSWQFLKIHINIILPHSYVLWMDSFIHVFQSKICSRLHSLPCTQHSLPILPLFFDTPVTDKQY